MVMISLMPNTSLAINLEPAEWAQLEKWGSAYGTPQQVALRCQIILGALAGQDNVSIAEHLGYRPMFMLAAFTPLLGGILFYWYGVPSPLRPPQ